MWGGGRVVAFAKVQLSDVLSKIKIIPGTVRGETRNDDGDLAELSPENIFYFKYAPTVSADVERSFSKYKVMLIDNCRSFVFDNSIINSHFHAIAHFKY